MATKKFETLEEALAYIKELTEANGVLKDSAKAAELENKNLKTTLDQVLSIKDKAEADLADALDQVKELSDQLEEAGNSDDVLKSKDNQLKQAILEKEAAVQEANDALVQMAEMGKKLSILENNRGDNNLIVEIDGKHYRILGNRFLVKGEELNAEQLSKNTAELERMIKIGSGSLVKVEAE